jgi:hypothetical protein
MGMHPSFEIPYGPHYVNSVNGQWISTKKDWQEQHRRGKHRRSGDTSPPDEVQANGPEISSEPAYDKEMDEMRCILYAHGG